MGCGRSLMSIKTIMDLIRYHQVPRKQMGFAVKKCYWCKGIVDDLTSSLAICVDLRVEMGRSSFTKVLL